MLQPGDGICQKVAGRVAGPAVIIGARLVVAGEFISGRKIQRRRYRPERGIAGVVVRVRSLDLARAAVEAGGITPVVHPEAVVVPPAFGNGVTVAFSRA